MRERPILFSAPMVRALLAGTKTQTRRVLTMNNSTVLGGRWGRNSPWAGLDFASAVPRTQSTIMQYIAGRDAPRDVHLDVPFVHPEDAAQGMKSDGCVYRVRPQWEPGDTLWVRETVTRFDKGTCDQHIQYRADGAWNSTRRPDPGAPYSVPSIFMPRWASRLTLRITDVRVERLNECSAADARAEGASFHDGHGVGHSGWRHDLKDVHASARSAYARLWDEINGPGSWAANPWVWAVSFERVPHG